MLTLHNKFITSHEIKRRAGGAEDTQIHSAVRARGKALNPHIPLSRQQVSH